MIPVTRHFWAKFNVPSFLLLERIKTVAGNNKRLNPERLITRCCVTGAISFADVGEQIAPHPPS